MSLPQVAEILDEWSRNIVLVKVIDAVNSNGYNIKQRTQNTFKGVIVPFTAEEINIVPEEMRSFQWFTIFTKNNLAISTNDEIIFDGESYKVKSKKNYSPYGYYEYTIVSKTLTIT